MRFLLLKLLAAASATGLVAVYGVPTVSWKSLLGGLSFLGWTVYVILEERQDAKEEAERKYERVKRYLEKHGYID